MISLSRNTIDRGWSDIMQATWAAEDVVLPSNASHLALRMSAAPGHPLVGNVVNEGFVIPRAGRWQFVSSFGAEITNDSTHRISSGFSVALVTPVTGGCFPRGGLGYQHLDLAPGETIFLYFSGTFVSRPLALGTVLQGWFSGAAQFSVRVKSFANAPYDTISAGWITE